MKSFRGLPAKQFHFAFCSGFCCCYVTAHVFILRFYRWVFSLTGHHVCCVDCASPLFGMSVSLVAPVWFGFGCDVLNAGGFLG